MQSNFCKLQTKWNIARWVTTRTLTHKKKVKERERNASQPDQIAQTECEKQIAILSLKAEQGEWREDDVNGGREADQDERRLFVVEKYGDHC